MFPPSQAVALPLLPTAGLAAFALYPPVARNPRLLWSFLGVSAILFAVELALLAAAVRKHRAFALEIVLRAQHYVQACAHTSIFLYWGWYWRPVYEFAYLIVAQLLFAYAFDMLLSWSRRDTYTLGFGPFPIIFSTNLFLWFRAGLVLSAVCDDRGRLRREGIHPLEQGRPAGAHLQSVLVHAGDFFARRCLLTGASDITWGQEIATHSSIRRTCTCSCFWSRCPDSSSSA